MIDDARGAFFFFYNFVQRYNVSFDYHFDVLQMNFNNITQKKYSVDSEYTSYFDIFKNYLMEDNKRVYLFWYICTLFYVPEIMLQRFYSYLVIETWRVQPEFMPEPYDVIRSKNKDELLELIKAYVAKGTTYLHMLIYAMKQFF